MKNPISPLVPRIDERSFVEEMLGSYRICDECDASLSGYADECTADLGKACTGYQVIEFAKKVCRLQEATVT